MESSTKVKALHKFLFFEITATIITLVFLGNLLEHRSAKQTTSAIQELTAMQELMATRETIKGETEQIPFRQIQKEDILIVNSGDKIPTDGIITEGVGILDESMLTGENEPVHRAQKDRVIGGTILADGNLKVKATLVKEIRSKDIDIKEVYSPFPIHGLDHALGLKRTRLAISLTRMRSIYNNVDWYVPSIGRIICNSNIHHYNVLILNTVGNR